MKMNSTHLHVQQMSFQYAGTNAFALRDISFQLTAGSWTVVTGVSGSGKTTLLRCLMPAVRPSGRFTGNISTAKWAHGVGYVMQRPADQIVMDDVRYELVFGLENDGLSTSEIERRLAETAHFFGIESWLDQKVSTLSGGQKQILNLASTLIRRPSLLLLDEPTAQLDPIALEHFLSLVERIRRETGTTILMTEHRLNSVLPLCHRIIHLESGSMAFDGPPDVFCFDTLSKDLSFKAAIPAVPRFFFTMTDGRESHLPRSVSEGRMRYATAMKDVKEVMHDRSFTEQSSPLLSAKDVSFRYAKKNPPVLKNINYRLPEGGIHAIVGGNGSGKSTLLRILAGVLSPQQGRVKRHKSCRIGLLPQDPRLVLTKETLLDDLSEFSGIGRYDLKTVKEKAVTYQLDSLLDRHPYDLSGGEMQRAAILKLNLLNPDIYLLDEPVKSLDSVTKDYVAEILNVLSLEGKTILLVTHDLEFAATIATSTALMFDRRIVTVEASKSFFKSNAFYTTDLARMTRGFEKKIVTMDDWYEESERDKYV